MIHRIFNKLISPFCNPILLAFFISFIGFFQIFPAILSLNYKYFIYITLLCTLQSYLILLIYNILPNNIVNKIYIYIITFLILLMHAFTYICNSIFNYEFNIEIAGIISETNVAEILEFCRNYITPLLILKISIFILLSYILLYFIIKHSFNLKPTKYFVFYILVLILAIVSWCRYPSFINYTFLGQIHTFWYVFQRTPEIIKTLTIYDLTQIPEKPKNIIFIIGESHSKDHCSLYGYEKETNPRLEALNQIDTLLIFRNVTSPSNHTLEAFKFFMSTYSKYNSSTEWYSSPSIPEIANLLNYKTYWIANQNKRGFCDNIQSKFSDICHYQIYSHPFFEKWENKAYDEVILPKISEISLDKTPYKFLFISLMGQHVEFYRRYPAQFNHFKISDYNYLPGNQREVIAQYDNATLYNDYIISEIISYFKDEEAIIIYMPDHGVDLFAHDEYFGHGRKNIPESYLASIQIPFLIYATSKYRIRFPEKYLQLKQITSKPFNTDDVIYLIMNIMNVKFSTN